MIRRMVLVGIWAAAVSLCAFGAIDMYGLLHPATRQSTPNPIPALIVTSARSHAIAAYDTALDVIVDGNLFRRDRSEAEEVVQTASSLPKPVVQRPRIELRGLMGGPPWEVLLDGMPGHPSSVLMRVGQTIAGITVAAVKSGTVVLTGADTIWHLTLRRQ